jgi:tryptophanase
MIEAEFAKVEVQTVVQQIAFPSVLDYVRFQLLATPMAVLLSSRDHADREVAIKRIAQETASFSDRAMLEGGGFSFRQEAYVGTGDSTS